MTARDDILARIAAARVPAAPPPPRAYQQADALSPEEARAKFITRITDYGVTVRQVTSAVNIADSVSAICAARGVSTIVIAPTCPQNWRPANVTTTEDHALPIGELAGFDAALTSAACAIAETGTLVLDGGPGQGRRSLSLLPDLHICVLFSGQIVECVPSAIARLFDAAEGGRAFTFISGPSATADIEFDRVQGVHGPRQLDLILVSATSRQ